MDIIEIKNNIPPKEDNSIVKNIIIVVLALVIITAGGSIYLNRSELPQVWKNVSLAAVSISSLFFPSESLSVTISNDVVESGKTFTVTYEHKGASTNGNHFFQYKCDDGLFLKLISDNNGIETPVFCDTPADIGKLAKGTLNILPVLTNSDSANSTLEIFYQRSGDEEERTPSSAVDIKIVKTLADSDIANKSQQINTVAPLTAGPKTEQLYKIGDKIASSTTATPTSPKLISNPNGYVDLSTKIIEIGAVDKTTNQFIATSTLRSGDRIAVRFYVKNIGTKTSKDWNFSASLPTLPWYIFQSDTVQPLAPGDRIEFTLGFDNIEKSDGNLVVINADPNNQLGDNLRANNIASTTINGVKP